MSARKMRLVLRKRAFRPSVHLDIELCFLFWNYILQLGLENLDLVGRTSRWKMPFNVFSKDLRHVFRLDSIGREILGIGLPAALAIAADPIASLVDTAFVGHLGAVELAGVGVSVAIFNQFSKIAIFPLVSITTSFVAEEDTLGKSGKGLDENEEPQKGCSSETRESENVVHDGSPENTKMGPGEHDLDIIDKKGEENEQSKAPIRESSKLDKEDEAENGTVEDLEKDFSTCDGTKKESKMTNKSEAFSVANTPICRARKKEKRLVASASTALIFGVGLGLLQALLLTFGAKLLLGLMGVKHNSPMFDAAWKYLTLRSLGAPAVLLSLAIQGIFRGFKDTKTPLYVIVFGYTVNIILDPILIFICKLGVRGAAISHVVSQYLIVLVLLWRLMQKVDLLSPSLRGLQFGRFFKNGGILLARVVAVTFCVTLSASRASYLGPVPMAAFQTCLQIWLTSSLLSDGLAVAGQAILACAFAEKDYDKTTSVATRVIQMSFVLGIGLAILVGVVMKFGAGIFSKDFHVQHLIHVGIPFVAATQPINSLAFVFDGVNFGASDFAYSAYSLVAVAIVSIVCIILLSNSNGFLGIWIALTIYMLLRTLVGAWRMGSGTGPWRYLRGQLLPYPTC